MVHIYSVDDLSLIGAVDPEVELGVSTLAFSGDGHTLAVCSDEPTLKLSLYKWKQVCVCMHASIRAIMHQVNTLEECCRMQYAALHACMQALS